jgi:hypothetical protein
MNNILDDIVEQYGDTETEIVIADGYDEAVIGIATDFTEPRIIYSVSKCLEILERDMDELEAFEHFTYNVSGGYVGEQTPIWCWDIY